jgi:hypothetical protein
MATLREAVDILRRFVLTTQRPLVVIDLDDTLIHNHADITTDEWFKNALKSGNEKDVLLRWQETCCGGTNSRPALGASEFIDAVSKARVQMIALTSRESHTAGKTMQDVLHAFGGVLPFQDMKLPLTGGAGIFYSTNKHDALEIIAAHTGCDIMFLDDSKMHICASPMHVYALNIVADTFAVGRIIVDYTGSTSTPAAWERAIRETFCDLPLPVTPPPRRPESTGRSETCTGFAVSGFIGSGKSTLAGELQRHGYRSISFAGPMKDLVSWLFNLPRHLLEGDTDESRRWRNLYSPQLLMTPRSVLQLFGTEVGRKADEDVWIRSLRTEIHGKVVITDARFPNELDVARNLGLKTVRVVRGDQTAGVHASETSHLEHKFDVCIDNSGSLEDLGRAASALVASSGHTSHLVSS